MGDDKLEKRPFLRALLQPSEWYVTCPACDEPVYVDVIEDNYGAFVGHGPDQFPECEACGSLIEAVAVQVSEAYPAATPHQFRPDADE